MPTDIFNLVSVTCDTAPLPSLEETLGILFPEAYPLRLQEGLVVRLGRVPGGWESGVGPTDYKWAVAVTWPGGWLDDCITIPDEDVQQVRAHLERGDAIVYLQTREEGEPALTLALIPPLSSAGVNPCKDLEICDALGPRGASAPFTVLARTGLALLSELPARAPSEPATAPDAPAAPSPLPASPDLATGALGPSEGK